MSDRSNCDTDWAVVAPLRRFLSLHLGWVADKRSAAWFCAMREGEIMWEGRTEPSISSFIFFWTQYWDDEDCSSWKDLSSWGMMLAWRRVRNSLCFWPSSPEMITRSRGRKAVLANTAVNKPLSWLSGWRDQNEVKNCSNVYFPEDKL